MEAGTRSIAYLPLVGGFARLTAVCRLTDSTEDGICAGSTRLPFANRSSAWLISIASATRCSGAIAVLDHLRPFEAVDLGTAQPGVASEAVRDAILGRQRSQELALHIYGTLLDGLVDVKAGESR
jgi:hypothetical protein